MRLFPSLLSVSLTLVALPLQAREGRELPYLDSAPTRFGTLTVSDHLIDGMDGRVVTLDTEILAETADFSVAIQDVLPVGEADFALITVAGGGNACPTLWQIVRLDATGVRVSAAFGTCSEALYDFRATSTGVEVDLAPFLDAALDHVTYGFDGGEISETAVAFSTEGQVLPKGGDAATRWLDQHPAMPFEDGGERLRFETIMDPGQVTELAARVTVANVASESDGFVVGEGIDPRAGGDIKGMWGIRISDGAPFAIFLDTGAPPVIFGMGEEDLPTAAILFLQGITE